MPAPCRSRTAPGASARTGSDSSRTPTSRKSPRTPSANSGAGVPSVETAIASPRPLPAFMRFSSASTERREKRGSIPPSGVIAPRTNGRIRSGAPSRTVTGFPLTRHDTADSFRALSNGRVEVSVLSVGTVSPAAKPSSARSVALPPTGRFSASSVAPPPRRPSASRSGTAEPHRRRSADRSEKLSPPANRSDTTDILPSVSVPVLSVNSKFMLPAASIPTGLRTRT